MTKNLVCLDFESTGIDVFEDRIVTATITEMSPKGIVEDSTNWLLNPGIEIPEGATEVHGVSTEHAQKHGVPAVEGVESIAHALKSYAGSPLVIYNANYDISLLTYELERHVLPPMDWAQFNIIDPYLLDKNLDKWRKGSRKLVDTAKHYGVEVDEDRLHESEYDNYLAGRVAISVVAKYNVTNAILKTQPELYRAWANDFEKYKRRTEPDFKMDSKDWPLKLKES